MAVCFIVNLLLLVELR